MPVQLVTASNIPRSARLRHDSCYCSCRATSARENFLCIPPMRQFPCLASTQLTVCSRLMIAASYNNAARQLHRQQKVEDSVYSIHELLETDCVPCSTFHPKENAPPIPANLTNVRNEGHTVLAAIPRTMVVHKLLQCKILPFSFNCRFR